MTWFTVSASEQVEAALTAALPRAAGWRGGHAGMDRSSTWFARSRKQPRNRFVENKGLAPQYTAQQNVNSGAEGIEISRDTARHDTPIPISDISNK